MTVASQSLDLFVLSCLFLTAESQRGQVSPPQNLSIRWINGFQPRLSWHSVEHCKYVGYSETTENDSLIRYRDRTQPWLLYVVMEGGFLQLKLEADCNGKRSEPATLNITHPELVKNLHCYNHAARQSRCHWLPASGAPDVKFFYRLLNNDFTEPAKWELPPLHIRECSSYRYTDGVRTGCDLEAGVTQVIDILFNGTLGNTLARNTFRKDFSKDVRPPPLQWTVTQTGQKFLISWTPPDIAGPWKFIINYTECAETKLKTANNGETSAELDLVPHCPYRMAIKAVRAGGETPWSDEKNFAADTNPNASLYVAVILPLVLGCLAAVVFVCCRNNKENLFPKVPEPRDFLSDISDNNNKINILSVYAPTAEEENCKITLVEDHLHQQAGLLTHDANLQSCAH